MSDLPWFKFDADAYLAQDIAYVSMESQAVFTTLCCLFWQKKKPVPSRSISRRFRGQEDRVDGCLKELLEEGIIVSSSAGYSVKFLKKQYVELEERHKKLSEAGRKGGQSKAKRSGKPPLSEDVATLKPPLSEATEMLKHKDREEEEDIDKEEEREREEIRTPETPLPETLFSDDTDTHKKKPVTDVEKWHYEIQLLDWAKGIKRAGAKIGGGNWTQWEALKTQFDMSVIVEGIKQTAPAERWPDKVEQTINKQNIALSGGGAPQRRVLKITL